MKSAAIQKWLPFVLGFLVIFTGMPKLIGVQMSVDQFHKWNLGDNVRLFTGILELILGIGIILKPTRAIAGLGFLMVTSAGFITHIASGEIEMLWMPIVFGLLTFWMLYANEYFKFR